MHNKKIYTFNIELEKYCLLFYLYYTIEYLKNYDSINKNIDSIYYTFILY